VNAAQSEISASDEFVKPQAESQTVSGDPIAADLGMQGISKAKPAPSHSLLLKSGRLVLFVLLVLFGSIMCLGAGVAILESIGSYYDEELRVGEFLFTAFFEGFLGWGALWCALRANPWAKAGRKSWHWVRVALTTGIAILIVLSLIVVLGSSAWLLQPLRNGNTDIRSTSDLTGAWSLDLSESSPDFGVAQIESGTLEFFAGGTAKRTLRLKQFGNITEKVSFLDEWKVLDSDKLCFKLRDSRERHELSISLSGDQLSFSDWETYGVETWKRALTKSQ
jgi:hypothetical protein